MTHADPIEQAAALRADTEQLLAAAPYDAGDAAPRRHIALTPLTPDEQNRALTAELNRHHTALQHLEIERDDLQVQVATVTVDRDQARAELAPALELLAVLDDVSDQLDRARAHYATRPRHDAAEPPHSAAGGTEVHDGATEAHRGAEGADDDELDAADLADAMERAESVRIDRDDAIWRPTDGGLWKTRGYRAMPLDRIEELFGLTRAVLLVDIEQDDEQDVGQADRDATLAQIARDAAQSDADVAAGRVSDHLGDPPPASLHKEQAPGQAGAQDQPLPGAVPITTAEHVELLSGALDATRRDLKRANAMADALAAALTAAMRTHDGAGVRPGMWDSWRDLLTEHAARSTACPTCSGPVRETVGMVCQTCGTDYSTQEG